MEEDSNEQIKISNSVEGISSCIVNEVMVCCQYMCSITSIKVTGDELAADFTAAVKSGNLDQVKKILESRDVAKRELEDAIRLATQAGHLNVVKFLAEECSVNLACESASGITPLHIAALNGHETLVEYILNQGIEPSLYSTSRITPFHCACISSNLSTVNALIEHASATFKISNLNVGAETGRSLLHCAVWAQSIILVQHLINELGACYNVTCSDEGLPPLFLAIVTGNLELVSYFTSLENIDINETIQRSGSISDITERIAPVHMAAFCGHEKILQHLISERKCNATCRLYDNGATALHLAIGNGHLNCVKFLLELDNDFQSIYKTISPALFWEERRSFSKYLNYDQQSDSNDFSFSVSTSSSSKHKSLSLLTSLHLQGNQHFAIFSLLTKKGYEHSGKNDKHLNTPLHFAARYGDLETVSYIVLEMGINPNQLNEYGELPVHLASMSGHKDIVILLHQAGKYNNHLEALTVKKRTPLHFAASQGHIHIVDYFTEKLSYQEMRKDDSGFTPAHLAVISGHLNILKIFVNNQNIHYDVNRDINDLGHSPIHSACIKGHIDIVKYLIEECGSDKLCRDVRDGYTLLHCAAINGHNHLIRYLHSQGCDVENRNKKGETPLHVAASHGQLDTVKLLIVDLQCDRESKAVNEQTPLHFAASEGHISVVQYLARDSNCDVMCRDTLGHTPAQLAILKGHLNVLKFFVQHFEYDVIGITNNIGQFAIHTACLAGQIKIAKYLFEGCHCDITCEDKDGNTPLHLAVSASKNTELMKYLVSEGCNRNAKRHHGVTPLHLAVAEGHLPIVECLTIELKCDIMQKDADGTTPAHVAVILGHIEILKFFVEGCMYEVKSDSNNNGEALIHSASFHGHTSIVKYLIEELECDPMSRDRKGNTPLHFAAVSGHNDVLIYFHEQGCEMMCRNTLQETPVHLAVNSGHLETLQFLLMELDCDQKAKGLKDRTPLHCAAAKGHLAIVKYLTSELDFDVLCKDKAGCSPANLAASNGQLEVLKFFVTEFHYNVNSDWDSTPFLPIHGASFYGHIDIVKYIVEECSSSATNLAAGDAYRALSIAVSEEHLEIIAYLHSIGFHADHKADNQGVSILHFAAERGQLKILKFLISELKCKKDVMNFNNQTPLHYAAKCGHLSVIKYLTIELNCDILCRDSEGNTPAHCAVSNGHLKVVKFCVQTLNYNAHIDRNNQGSQPIHSACLYGHHSTLRYLIEELKCDLMSKNDNGTTPIHYAAAGGKTSMISYLQEKGCNVECLNKYGNTPLHMAAEKGRVENVKMLISTLKCDRDIKNFNQRTPLHQAASKSNLSVVKLLTTELHCDIMSKDCDGDTPLQCAVDAGQTHIVKYFVEKLKYDIHTVRNALQQSALHYAALKGCFPIVKYLISQGVDPVCMDVFRNQPLHYAAAIGHYEIVHYLVSNGSPISARGIMGKTAADIARINGHRNIQNLLDYLSLSVGRFWLSMV